MTTLLYLFCATGGYLFGCLNPAYLLARRKGFDIRDRGSKGSGASNALITMGWGSAVFVALIDIGKAALSAFLAALAFPQLPAAAAAAGTACVLGHIYPFYMHFRGGKGFAPFAGLILALDWKFFLVIVVLVITITLITDYIALGTLTTVISFPTWTAIHGNLFPAAIVCIASVVIIYKHLINIQRMLNGTEIGLRRANRHDAPK